MIGGLLKILVVFMGPSKANLPIARSHGLAGEIVVSLVVELERDLSIHRSRGRAIDFDVAGINRFQFGGKLDADPFLRRLVANGRFARRAPGCAVPGRSASDRPTPFVVVVVNEFERTGNRHDDQGAHAHRKEDKNGHDNPRPAG